jgi:hypothetical protein
MDGNEGLLCLICSARLIIAIHHADHSRATKKSRSNTSLRHDRRAEVSEVKVSGAIQVPLWVIHSMSSACLAT